ncbi:MAG: hypothetical protein OXP71_01145 [Candidatus Poribacteria bacterium]|nr:hypothetical protein [Candidatus Poribacteria bacterium]
MSLFDTAVLEGKVRRLEGLGTIVFAVRSVDANLQKRLTLRVHSLIALISLRG